MWGDLLRWNASDGRWYTLDNCYRGPFPGATMQECVANYDCYHPTALRRYRGATSGYAVVRGIGYFGTDYSPTEEDYCD